MSELKQEIDRKASRKARQVLIAATSINLVIGVLYIWGVISRALVEEWSWSHKEASLPYTIATLSFVLCMVLFGRVQDVYGPRITATLGGAMTGGGLLLAGLFPSPLLMPIFMGLMAGGGIGILNVCTTPPAVKWFPPEKKGMVTGIVVAGVSVSSLWLAPVANFLIGEYGVRWVFLVIGGIALTVTVLAAQVLNNPPTVVQKHADDVSSKLSEGLPFQKVLKHRHFWFVWVMLALSSSAGLMVIGHIGNIASSQGNIQNAYLLVMLLAFFNSIGRFAGGSLSDRFGRPRVMQAIFILQCLNMFAFRFYQSPLPMALGVAVAGLCYGATFSIFPATIADLFGLKDFGTNFGLMFTGWGLGGVIGPMTAAIVADIFGHYDIAFYLSALLLMLALLLTFTLPQHLGRR